MNCPYVMKRCTKCGEILHISRYYKKKTCRYGVNSYCKQCDYKSNKNWKDNNSNKLKEYQSNYYNNNKEQILDYQKNYRKNHKKERKEYDKIYQNKNKDKIRIRRLSYVKNNPHIIFNNDIKRRLRAENQGSGITKEQWYEMMKFFDFKCAYSDEYIGGDSDKRTIDHIIPITKNGEHEVWNCVPMYANYNYSKNNANMLEWYLEQPFFSIERLTKIYEWRIYAYEKWGKEM